MARPKTKGPTIGVQLPTTIDRQVRELAKRQRTSPGQWIGRIITSVVATAPATDPEPRSDGGTA